MNSLFDFGAKKTTRSPSRKTKRSPKRSPGKKCNKDMTLAALRKIATTNGINIYSESRTAVSKRTGLPKKSKMVGCSTLMKRINEAGLGHLYKVRKMQPDVVQSMPVITQADPACNADFKKFLKSNPDMSGMYKGYAVGGGPCSNREFVLVNPYQDVDDMGEYADVANFDMNYGARRAISGARPKLTQLRVGEITIRGKTYQVFKGIKGGLYYMKGKTGRKVYIDKPRLRKQ